MTRFSAALLAVVALLLVTRAAHAETYARDEKGRSLRVEFDPASRIWFAAFAGSHWGLESSFDYRAVTHYGVPGDRVRWQLDHRLVATTYFPSARSVEGVLYRGTFLRHADGAYLTLPSNPPSRIAFPFDVGLDVTLGALYLPAARGDRARVGAARVALLLDPWRSAALGQSLELGVAARYDLDWSPDAPDASLTHRVAPLTSPQARWRWQDRPGLTRSFLEAAWIPHWSVQESGAGWNIEAIEARARFERVVFALNDEPIVLFVGADYRRFPQPASSSSELRICAGLGIAWQLKR